MEYRFVVTVAATYTEEEWRSVVATCARVTDGNTRAAEYVAEAFASVAPGSVESVDVVAFVHEEAKA